MDKKVIIIGSGLAGAIAYNALREYNPKIIEKASEPEVGSPLDIHPAVMRLRDFKVAEAIGAPYEEITVTKGIFYRGEILTESNIQLNNLYSRKVYGALGRRSLNALGDHRRYLIKGYRPPDDIAWGREVKAIGDGVISCEFMAKTELFDYDLLISTLPMPKMAFDIVGAPEDFQKRVRFGWNPVHVLRTELLISSDIHQTLYFPDPNTPIYRMTIQCKTVIIESIEEESHAVHKRPEWLDLLCEAFGLWNHEVQPHAHWTKMPIGKIHPVDDDDRRRYIMWLTDEHKIFSFGRFATWRPLRTDHLLDDIKKIKRIISASDVTSRYKARM